MTTPQPTPADAPGAARLFFGVAADAQTYRNLAYLLLSFPLGVLYFTVIVSGGSASIGTIPILVGVPMLVAVLAVAREMADVERKLASSLLDVDLHDDSPETLPDDLWTYGREILTDVRTYASVVYLLSKFVVGLAAFVGLTVASVLSVTLAFLPLYWNEPFVHADFGFWTVSSLPDAMLASVAGVLLAFVTLHLVNLAARVHGVYTEVMLDRM
ncbi:MAG: sensor domain-containing protein [Haloferacaceae archaeon]